MSTQIVTQDFYLAPAAQLETILRAYQLKKDFIEQVLNEGVDFGPIPGSTKPALLKPGAEKLNNLFSLYPTFDHIQVIEDWTGDDHKNEPFFYYHERANLWRILNGERVLVASADGSCNSWEKKYRYRQADRVCPSCGQAAIFKSKNKPEFYCWSKRGGCGQTFPLTDKRITDQEVGQVKNPDVADLVNTILKMAQKRALVAATLIATSASDYFTQDVDDYIDGDYREAPRQAATTGATPAQPGEPPQPEPPEPPSAYNGNGKPTPAGPALLVEIGVCENVAHAAQLINNYVPQIIRGNREKLATWGIAYRDARTAGKTPAEAAEIANKS